MMLCIAPTLLTGVASSFWTSAQIFGLLYRPSLPAFCTFWMGWRNIQL